MDDMFSRMAIDLVDRVSGPMKFRLVLQPTMAIVYAIIAGVRDARAGRMPYMMRLATDGAHRRQIIRDGWKSVGKVFILALVLDVVYQWMQLRFVYAGEAIVVAIILAIIPYMIMRGLVDRLMRRRLQRRASLP
jgi:hypothetical protein